MEVASTWSEAITGVSAWVPTSHNARWRRSHAVYWRCTSHDEAAACGVIVDPMLPNLGQHSGTRTFRATTERIVWKMRHQMLLQPGQIYVTFGCVAPSFQFTAGQWEVELPRPSFCSGTCRLAGQFAPTMDFNVAELFSGYMGGWTCAADEMPNWDVQIVLDHDKEAVGCYCLNHPGQVIHDPAHLVPPLSDQTLIVCADFEDLGWLNALNFRNVNTFTVSAPCQSWSGMGTKSGTGADTGKVLVRAVQIARLVQPALVLVEQVAGFRQHAEFDDFLRTRQEAGYRLMSSTIHDLELLSFTTRRRWFGVFMNTVHISNWEHVGRWMHPILREKHTFQPDAHCLTVFTEPQRAEVTISEQDYQILNDPSLLPQWVRHAPGAQSGALPFRIQGTGMIWPTIPASYRSSVAFGRDFLSSDGLMTWVIRDAYGDVRWANKFEAAKALGFSAMTILPVQEDEGFKAVGQSISPLQAALVFSQAQEVCRLQSGVAAEACFPQVVSALRAKQGPLSDFFIRSHGMHHEALARRMPQPPDVDVECPHCHSVSNQPLLLACKKCCMVACHRCLTDTCLPSHFNVVQEITWQQELQDLNVDETQPIAGVRLFTVIRVETGYQESLECDVAQTLGQAYLFCDLPQGSVFFRNQIMIPDDVPPQHGEVYHAIRNPRCDDCCPLCLTQGMNKQLRLCLLCNRVGCELCIVDKCARCTGGHLSCRTCHERAADSHVRALHESVSLRMEHDTQPCLPEWDWTLSCDIEGEWELLTVLVFPSGRATVKRSLFHNTGHILYMVRKMGYEVPNEVQIFWGDSTTPHLHKAVEGYILIVPTNQLGDGRIPVICRTPRGEQIRMCPPTQPADSWVRSMLTPDEAQAGHKVLYRQQVLEGLATIALGPGEILTKVPPWPQQKRALDYPEEGLRLLDSALNREPVEPLQTAGLGGSVPGTITNWCGAVMLDGSFQPLPLPLPGQTWAQWTAHLPLPPLDSLWATSNGRQLAPDQPMDGRPILLRLHGRVRGGGRSSGKHEALSKKLASHLQSKGVPLEEAASRAEAVINTVGATAVQDAYETTDPWRALKTAAGTRIRLVKPEELKLSKAKPSSSDGNERGPDPWSKSDPWSQGRGHGTPSSATNEVPISLLPGFFLDESDHPLPILPHLVAEGKGVALLSTEETRIHAEANYLLSEEELAAVVVSPSPPSTGQMPCKPISFTAMHGDQKVLLRGYIVDFGQKPARMKESAHRVTVELEDMVTIALEIRREYQTAWEPITKNPLRFAWATIDGLQQATATTRSRKYFSGRKDASPDTATTWHCFVKIPGNNIDQFLAQSGKAGVFVIPKSNGATSLAGHYRIIWLDHADLDRAATVQRTHPDILGL